MNCFRSEYRSQHRACMQPGSGCGIFFSPGSLFPPPVLLIGNTIIEPRGCFKQPFPLRGVRIPPGRAFCIIGNSEEFPIIQEKPLKNQGFQAETVGFEPTCRDEPTNAFRVFYSQHTLADFEEKCPILRVNALVRKKMIFSPLRLFPTVRNARELSERTDRTAIKHNSRKSL